MQQLFLPSGNIYRQSLRDKEIGGGQIFSTGMNSKGKFSTLILHAVHKNNGRENLYIINNIEKRLLRFLRSETLSLYFFCPKAGFFDNVFDYLSGILIL